MSYKIVVDSCCDLTEEMRKDSRITVIPLTLTVDGRDFIDDETFNQREYLDAVAASKEVARTACPSPQAFCKAYEGPEDMVFVVTLSQHLSASYNSAILAKNLFFEEEPESLKKIHVFSSDSACVGETLIALKVMELAEQGVDFDEITDRVTEYRNEMVTFFVLESLETLRKNGRLTGLAAILATTLNIKPIMKAEHGIILKADQCRGIPRALNRMVDHVVGSCRNPEEKTLAITHIGCPERAEKVKAMLLDKLNVKDVLVINGAGVSSTYACEGGIVVCI